MNANDDRERTHRAEEPSGSPSAVVEPRRRATGLVWLVPAAALLVSSVVAWRSWQARGIPVRVTFAEAHGLRVGDPVRASGVDVGVVRAVTLVADGGATPIVEVDLAVSRSARGLLRSDSGFWIQRPRVDFDGIGGLDTVAGGRWVGLRPGVGADADGPFTGLETPPVVTEEGRNGLEIVLDAPARWGMRPGGAVTYRGLQVGTILDLVLATDARSVEARLRIDAEHTALVREGTRFFSTSGIGFELGLQGLRADIESLETIVAGGVAFATPPDAGPAAAPGARFPLAERPDDDWLDWAPAIARARDTGPAPTRVPAVVRYRSGLLDREQVRAAWAVMLSGRGLVVPGSLLDLPENARDPILEIAGKARPIPAASSSGETGNGSSRPWLRRLPSSNDDPAGEKGIRTLDLGSLEAEATLLVWSAPAAGPVPVPPHRWRTDGDGLLVDPEVDLADRHHGGAVMESGTDRLVGILVIRDGVARVVEIPATS